MSIGDPKLETKREREDRERAPGTYRTTSIIIFML